VVVFDEGFDAALNAYGAPDELGKAEERNGEDEREEQKPAPAEDEQQVDFIVWAVGLPEKRDAPDGPEEP
jgi:hypothetical protein